MHCLISAIASTASSSFSLLCIVNSYPSISESRLRRLYFKYPGRPRRDYWHSLDYVYSVLYYHIAYYIVIITLLTLLMYPYPQTVKKEQIC